MSTVERAISSYAEEWLAPVTDQEAEGGWKDRKNQDVCMSHQGHTTNSLRPPWEKRGLKVLLEEVQNQWGFMVIGHYTLFPWSGL